MLAEVESAPEFTPLKGTYGELDWLGVAKGLSAPVPPPVRLAPLGCYE